MFTEMPSGRPNSLLPRRALAAGLAEHEAGERDDEARLLGDGDELGRRHLAAVGPRPARQRLEAGDLGRRQADDRLVVHGELVALDALAQLGLERQPAHRAGVHHRVEQLVAAAAGGLRAVHRDVGVAQQVVHRADTAGRPARCPMLADAYSSRSVDARTARPAPAADDRRPGTTSSGDAEVVDEHGELVAAEPRQGVARPQVRLEARGDGDQELVADQVAQAVVDQLEAVEVDEEDRVAAGPTTRALCAIDRCSSSLKSRRFGRSVR